MADNTAELQNIAQHLKNISDALASLNLVAQKIERHQANEALRKQGDGEGGRAS